MANNISFTPQEIEQFLQQFFDVVGARQYVGARYIPIFGRAGSDTVEWDDLAPYEPLTVVMHDGVSYVSRRYVPAGIDITDTAYWAQTYRFNAQVEQYRQEVLSFQGQIDEIREDFVPFPDAATLPKYGTDGQVLSTLTNGKTKWVAPVVPSDEQAEEVITQWLDDHPEATTTVQDGAITTAKLADGSVTDAKLAQSGGVLESVSNIWDVLDYYLDTNQLTGTTWTQGLYASFSTFSNNTINPNSQRLSIQIELPEAVKSVTIAPIASVQFKAGIFAADGTAIANSGDMRTTEWTHSASASTIKYVRISYGMSPNAPISAYNGELGLFVNALSTLDSIAMRLPPVEAGLEQVTADVERLDVITEDLFVASYPITFDSDNLELGSFSNGVPTETTLRARTKAPLVVPSGILNIVCLNDTIEYEVLFFRNDGSYNSATSWMSGNNTINVNTLSATASHVRLLIKRKTGPYELTVADLDTFDLHAGFSPLYGNDFRLTVMSHNCGKFNYGNDGGYSGDDVSQQVEAWKDMIAKYKPDVILAQELATWFDSGQTINAYNTIYAPLFPFHYFLSFGHVISKLKTGAVGQINLSVTYEGQNYPRAAGYAHVVANGVDIMLCSAHLLPGSDAASVAVRETERSMLIAALADFDHVILAGDFNAPEDAFYDPFKTAGYSCANHGYFGTKVTTITNRAIDNIMVKGMTLYDCLIDADDSVTSDHVPVVSEVHVTL